jgi:hypothetical protein
MLVEMPILHPSSSFPLHHSLLSSSSSSSSCKANRLYFWSVSHSFSFSHPGLLLQFRMVSIPLVTILSCVTCDIWLFHSLLHLSADYSMPRVSHCCFFKSECHSGLRATQGRQYIYKVPQ